MPDEVDASLEEEAKALRRGATRGRRTLLFAMVGNLLIFVVLVGLPYFRGRARAAHGRRALARYAACLVGGRPADDPGLALPEGAEEYYADRARAGEWESCRSALRALRPDDAFWLFPSTRQAESEVRRAAAMAEEELDAVLEAPPGRTPERPWLALGRVVAAFTLWMQAADAQGNLFDESLVFDEEAMSVRPERVPIQAAVDAQVRLRTRADGLEVLALDARGISWVVVSGGGLDPRRLRRSALVRDGRFYGPSPWIVWATPEARCGDSACIQRATGLARLDDGVVESPEPHYFAAHIAGSVARNLFVGSEDTWMVARRAEGVALVKIPNDELLAGDGDGPPLEVSFGETRALRAPLLVQRSDVELWGIDESGRLRDGEGSVRATGVGWVEGAGQHVFAGANGGVLHLRDGGESFLELPLESALVAGSSGEEATVAGLVDGELIVARCEAECVHFAMGPATSFSVTYSEDLLIVGHSRGDEIQVVTWGSDGPEAPQIPAPCWSENGGFCAPFSMTSRDGRIVIAGRDEHDLMVVESADGRRWERLAGLR